MKDGNREPFPWALVLGTVIFLAGGIGFFLWLEETRDQVIEMARMVFSIFTTPFILETSIAVLGLLAVVTFNQWRLMKDGEEWVDADKVEPEKKE